MCKILLAALFLFIVSSLCQDLLLGYPDAGSKVIYSQVHQGNPAVLWVSSDTITVNCSSNEVINAIRIMDLRSDKWGEAYIKGGGIGQSYVTIELDSPNAFRGYNFFVEVYAIEANTFLNNHG